MSGILGGLLSGAGALSQATPALTALGINQLAALGVPSELTALIKAPRSIGTILPDVVIEENHDDRVQVTQHPVASGSPVSDHAFVEPHTLTMRCGWTNSNPIGAITQGAIAGFTSGGILGGLEGAAGINTGPGNFLTGAGALGAITEQRVRSVYNMLLNVLNTLQPITVTTGKRKYESMLMIELGVRTDHTSEYALMLEAHFQFVNIVRTQETTQPAIADQSAPDKTGSPVASPSETPVPNPPGAPDPNSLLLHIFPNASGGSAA